MNPPEQQQETIKHPNKDETFLDLAIKSLADNRLDESEKEELNKIIKEYNKAVDENRTETRKKLKELENEKDLKNIIKESDGYKEIENQAKKLKTKEIKSIRCELGIDANGKFGINDYIAYKNSPYIKYSLNEFLEKISYEGFLKLSFEKRLEAVTEGNIKLEDVLNGKVKNIRFSFPFKELENKVKLDDLIPKELTVWQGFNVYSWNDNGYFSRTKIPKVNKSKKTPDNNRIKIQNGTELSFEKPNFRDKIKVDGITPEELDKILHLDFYPITKNKFGKETEILFRCALQIAGLPEEWATSKEFAQLIGRESVASTGKGNERGLKVGVLNHTIKGETTESFKRKAVESSKKQNPIGSKSTASGLGQLLLYNVDIYYPDGREGIGDPLNEAVGMVRYIAAAYNNPKNALKFHLEHNYY